MLLSLTRNFIPRSGTGTRTRHFASLSASVSGQGHRTTLQTYQRLTFNTSIRAITSSRIASAKFTMPAPQQSVIPCTYSEDQIDPSQLQLLAEECILVNDKDEVIGHDSKKKCHLINQVTGDIPLHRAFSVFLFNSKGQLLLQQRSKTKITFPSMYSNTCCSHPLYTNADEMVEKDALGVKVAAQRRLYEELGIPKEQIPLEAFKYLTRVHYKANSGNSIWGEHEIDYILFVQADVQIKPNTNEVDDVRYMSLEEFQKFSSNSGDNKVQFTPWFNLITKTGKLQEWWNGMNDLSQFQEFDKIYRL